MRSKKGMYNYFVLTFGVILLVTAFITLFTQREVLNFNTLGSRSDFLLKQTVEQDLLQLRLDECAKRAANQAVIGLILNNTPSDKINYYYSENTINSLFIDKFYEIFVKEIEAEELPFKFEKETINIKDGSTIFGFGKRVYLEKSLEIEDSSGKDRKHSELNLSYIPKFSYKFQRYNLTDFQKIYGMMNDFVLVNFSGCKKDENIDNDQKLKDCVMLNYNKIPLVDIRRTMEINFDDECTNQFNDEYFIQFSKEKNIYETLIHKDKYFTICLTDSTRLLSGNSKYGFVVKKPTYLFFLQKDKIDKIQEKMGFSDITQRNALNPVDNLLNPKPFTIQNSLN
jgi:hypothetical protein